MSIFTKLSYIGTKDQQVQSLKELAKELFEELNIYLPKPEYDFYKEAIETDNEVEELEKLIEQLDSEGNYFKEKEEEEQYYRRRGLDDDWDHNTDTYSKI